MSIVIDASFGHAQITPANMARIGASGAILYTGCDAAAKNATKAEVQALLDAGVHVGLVIENFADDMRKGAAEGARLGRNVVAGAKALGYDVDNCVLYTAADWNSQGADLDAIDAAMRAFAAEVPHPGLYGNSYALERCHATGHAEYLWQSNSTAFSNGPSPHAHLLQRYNDPRAVITNPDGTHTQLPVDVNDPQLTPLGLMGETMELDPNDPVIVGILKKLNAVASIEQSLAQIEIWGDQTHPDSIHSIAQSVAALQASVDKLTAAVGKIQTGNVDPVALAQAIVAHIQIIPK